MLPTARQLNVNLIRAALVLCTGLLCSVLASGSAAKTETVAVPAVEVGTSLALDPAIFGSSAGQASIKAAPATWSSRSNVRWNARWTNSARYLV